MYIFNAYHDCFIGSHKVGRRVEHVAGIRWAVGADMRKFVFALSSWAQMELAHGIAVCPCGCNGGTGTCHPLVGRDGCVHMISAFGAVIAACIDGIVPNV